MLYSFCLTVISFVVLFILLFINLIVLVLQFEVKQIESETDEIIGTQMTTD